MRWYCNFLLHWTTRNNLAGSDWLSVSFARYTFITHHVRHTHWLQKKARQAVFMQVGYRWPHDNNPASHPECFVLSAEASSAPCQHALLFSAVLTAPPAPPPLWPSGGPPGSAPTPATDHYPHGRLHDITQHNAFSKLFYTKWLSEGIFETFRGSKWN